MSEVLNLDSLVPQEVVVKLGGQSYTVKPARTQDVLKLASLGQAFQKAQQDENVTDDRLAELVSKIEEQVVKCIPDMHGKQLSMAQLIALMQLINKMSIPVDSKELEKAGITKQGPKETA